MRISVMNVVMILMIMVMKMTKNRQVPCLLSQKYTPFRHNYLDVFPYDIQNMLCMKMIIVRLMIRKRRKIQIIQSASRMQ